MSLRKFSKDDLLVANIFQLMLEKLARSKGTYTPGVIVRLIFGLAFRQNAGLIGPSMF